MPARLLVPSWVSCHCDARGTALSRTRVRASGEWVAGTWAGVRLGPDKGPWVDWSVAVQGSWPSSHLGQTGEEWRQRLATGQQPEWLQPAGRLFRPTSQSGSAVCAGGWRGRRQPQGRRARLLPGRWTSGPLTHLPACTWHCWTNVRKKAQRGRDPRRAGFRPAPQSRLTLPGRRRRPGGPVAPTPAARAPGAGAARTPSAPAGWGRGESAPGPAPGLGLRRTPT